MKNYFYLILKELKELFFLKISTLLIIIISLILGYSFYSAATLYSNASMNALNNPLYASGFEPVQGVFIPAFGSLFIIFSLFLPFLFIPLIINEKKNNTLTVLLQLPFNLMDILSAKIISSLLFLLFIISLSIPSIIIWKIFGGYIAYLEFFLLIVGYFIYGILILSISIFSAVIIDNTAGASILSIILIILSWLIDFGRDMNISTLVVSISDWTFTRQFKYFEDGILSIQAIGYFILLSGTFFILAYFFLRFDLKNKIRHIIFSVLCSFILIFVFSKINLYYDITESYRNSFSKTINQAIKKVDSLEINIYLEKTDSRFKDFEKSFLRKLFLIKSDVKVNLIKGKKLEENYGLTVYNVNGKLDKTYSNSEEEIFPIIFNLAGLKIKNIKESKNYPGYPMVIRSNQQRTIILVYFILIPFIMITLFIGNNLLRRRQKLI